MPLPGSRRPGYHPGSGYGIPPGSPAWRGGGRRSWAHWSRRLGHVRERLRACKQAQRQGVAAAAAVRGRAAAGVAGGGDGVASGGRLDHREGGKWRRMAGAAALLMRRGTGMLTRPARLVAERLDRWLMAAGFMPWLATSDVQCRPAHPQPRVLDPTPNLRLRYRHALGAAAGQSCMPSTLGRCGGGAGPGHRVDGRAVSAVVSANVADCGVWVPRDGTVVAWLGRAGPKSGVGGVGAGRGFKCCDGMM